MRREKIKKRAFAMAACCVALLSCTLCVSCLDDAYEEGTLGETDEGTFSVQLRVVVKNLADGYGYEDGTGYENYIRLTEVSGTGGGINWNRDYRIYFFNTDDRWIGSLDDFNIIEKTGSDYTVYDILGETAYFSPDSEPMNMKVVMVANWMSYPNYSGSGSSSYTLNSLCNNTKFDALVDENGQALLPSPENGLMPFYGICEYKNVTFEAGKRTTLSEDISLLRAMAKVEVVLENEDLTFTDVKLHGYNAQGYCAPTGVESQKDYVHNEWSTDYVSTLHLANNKNDTDATSNTMSFVQTQVGSDTQYETWAAYVPEYDNSGTDFSYITVTINGKEYNINFADYTDGVTDNAAENRFDIHRNNLYRFYVKFNQREDILNVTVTKWNERTGSFIVFPNGNGNAQYV